jgi:hypothetical protein
MRSMLHAWRLNLNLWGEVVQITIHVLNRAGSKTHEGVTTYELWTWWKPLVGYFRIFGCTTYAFVPKEFRESFILSLWKLFLWNIVLLLRLTDYGIHWRSISSYVMMSFFKKKIHLSMQTIILKLWSYFMWLYGMKSLMQPWNQFKYLSNWIWVPRRNHLTNHWRCSF